MQTILSFLSDLSVFVLQLLGLKCDNMDDNRDCNQSEKTLFARSSETGQDTSHIIDAEIGIIRIVVDDGSSRPHTRGV